MGLAPRFLVATCAVAWLPVACSSTTESEWKIPAPPSGNQTQAQGGSGGSGGGTTAGSSSTAGSSTGGADAACTKATDCPTNGFCKAMACACPLDKPDVCAGEADPNPKGACVSKQNDPDNCGECGTKCDAGAACVAGTCGVEPIELTTSADCGSIRLALGGATLYWAELMSGKIKSVALPGAGAATGTDVATAQVAPSQIAVDAGGVYWVNQGDATAGSSKIMKKALPIAAGEPVVLTASPDTSKILAIAVRGDKLYYTLGFDIHQISTNPATKTDIIVGTATNYDLKPPAPVGIPSGLALGDAHVVWTTAERQGVELETILEGNDGYVELGESQGDLLLPDLATDSMYTYWANGEHFVRAKNTLKGNEIISQPPKFDPITAFAVNATNVYFAAELGQILKHDLVPVAEEEQVPAVAIARDQLDVSSVVLDAANVYWASACVIRSSKL